MGSGDRWKRSASNTNEPRDFEALGRKKINYKYLWPQLISSVRYSDCPWGVWMHVAWSEKQVWKDLMLSRSAFQHTLTFQFKEQLLPTPSAVHFYPALILLTASERPHSGRGTLLSLSLAYAIHVKQGYSHHRCNNVDTLVYSTLSAVTLVPMTIEQSSHLHFTPLTWAWDIIGWA